MKKLTQQAYPPPVKQSKSSAADLGPGEGAPGISYSNSRSIYKDVFPNSRISRSVFKDHLQIRTGASTPRKSMNRVLFSEKWDNISKKS
jgi:hypothetical protein